MKTVHSIGMPSEANCEDWQGWMREARELRAALDEHAIMTITDREGRITFVNDKFCAISKYAREELVGQSHSIVNSGHHPKAFFRDLWDAIKRGQIWHGEIRNRTKDGCCYWAATTIVPFLDEAGKPWQFVAICSDITAQKRGEAELEEKLRLQRLLAELSARFLTLPSHQVDSAIEETQRIIVEALGIDRSALLQLSETDGQFLLTHYWQAAGWPEAPGAISANEYFPWSIAAVQRGECLAISDVEELPPDAARDKESFRSFQTKSTVVIPLQAGERVAGAITFATLREKRNWREDEITTLKLLGQIIGNVLGRQQAELREEELRANLAHANRVATLGEMAATLAHELNQPLSAILSNAQAARRFLARGAIDHAELGAILDDIVRDDKRAGNVIRNLHSMVSNRPAAREVCCLNELTREVIELMHGELIVEKIEVRAAPTPELPRVEAVRVELQQVMVNLIVNAVHAMSDTPPGQRFIDLEIRVDAPIVTLCIRDRGHGLPPDRLAGVFLPFFSTRPSGLGMGLSICRRIIESHGGHIEAGNHAEGGAVFRITLPLARE